MTTGMKKFTKGCLITALVIFIIGVVLCGVGGLLGGFGLLNSMDIREVTGIPLIFRIGPRGIEYGFRFWEDDTDWSGYENWQRISDNEGERTLALTADTLRDLYIDVAACELHIEESEDEYVGLAASGNKGSLRYYVEENGLRIVRKPNWTWKWMGVNTVSDKVYLYLPKGTSLDYADIEFGVGAMESIGLAVRDANIKVGAGEIDIESLTADNGAILSVGAGKIRIRNLVCRAADLDIGAGEMDIDNAEVAEDVNIGLDMGSVNIGGVIMGDLDVDCGMGTVILDMDDAEQDHNFKIDCSMGTVMVGSHSYSGIGGEQTINNGSSSDFDIDCSMGTVTVKFDK